MKITTVLGSPKNDGNTNRVLTFVEEALEEKGHEVNRINIADKDVKPCIANLTCMQHPDKPVCPTEDDAASIFEDFIASDAIVYSTPIYCWGFTAQLKALIDRCGMLITFNEDGTISSLLEGKKTALLVTCGGPEEDNADLIQTAFNRFSQFCKTEVTNILVVPNTTTPDKLPENIKDKAENLASSFWG